MRKFTAVFISLLSLSVLVGATSCSLLEDWLVKPSPVMSEDMYKASCSQVPFQSLDENSDQYSGIKVTYLGKIEQITKSDIRTDIRMDVARGEYNWKNTIYVTIDGTLGAAQGDNIQIWGEVQGRYTYEPSAGSVITLPLVKAKYVQWPYKLWKFPSSVANQLPEFPLTAYYEVIDDGGWPSLRIRFDSAYDTRLRFIYPDGAVMMDDYFPMGNDTETTLRMSAHEYEPPIPGKYTLIVQKQLGKLIGARFFEFSGANVIIDQVKLDWYRLYSGHYDLNGISLNLSNQGDLPAYLVDGTIFIDVRYTTFFFSSGTTALVLLPGDERTVVGKTYDNSSFLKDIRPVAQKLTIKLRDNNGVAVCTYSSTVVPKS